MATKSTAEGFTGTSNWAVNTPASFAPTLGGSTSGTANSGYGALTVTTDISKSNEGVSKTLTGTFLKGHTYKAVVYARGDTATDLGWELLLGASDTDKGVMAVSGTSTSYTQIVTSWKPSSWAMRRTCSRAPDSTVSCEP